MLLYNPMTKIHTQRKTMSMETMFDFIKNLFTSKPDSNPLAIGNTHQTLNDDKLKAERFYIEIKEIMEISNNFPSGFIDACVKSFKYKRKAQQGFDFKKITHHASFDRSAREDWPNRIYQWMVSLAYARASNYVDLLRFKKHDMKVKINFSHVDKLCKNMLVEKRKYHGKTFSPDAAPLLPLQTCFKCPYCPDSVTYMPKV